MTTTITENYFIVICRGDREAGAEPAPYELATRAVFSTSDAAEQYAAGISTSREPLVVSGRFFQLRHSWTAWRYPSEEEIADGRGPHEMVRLGESHSYEMAHAMLPLVDGVRTGQLQEGTSGAVHNHS